MFFAIDSVNTDNGFKVTSAHSIPEFSLTTHYNKDFSFSEVKDDIKVVDFFFTRCGGICPKMTTQLTRVQEVFENDDYIKILSITVDPVYDTPDTLKTYADHYGANKDKWLFLTGPKDTIYRLAQKGFFLSAMEQPLPGQRWVSDSEPELGLGVVMKVEFGRVEIYFPAAREHRERDRGQQQVGQVADAFAP